MAVNRQISNHQAVNLSVCNASTGRVVWEFSSCVGWDLGMVQIAMSPLMWSQKYFYFLNLFQDKNVTLQSQSRTKIPKNPPLQREIQQL